MAVTLQRESTEYLYVGVTGGVPTGVVQMAFLAAGVRPTEPDWESAILVDDAGDPLWADATASGVAGDYYIARLVGAYDSNDVVLSAGDYQVWVRITDTTEQPVRIAPIALEIA